jgi:galactokinase
MEAQTAKELADNERDERARMTSVERAAKAAEHDRKRAEKEAEEEAQRAAKVVERDRKRAAKELAEEAQRVAKAAAKAAERDAKWTPVVGATIERRQDCIEIGQWPNKNIHLSQVDWLSEGIVRHHQASCANRSTK